MKSTSLLFALALVGCTQTSIPASRFDAGTGDARTGDAQVDAPRSDSSLDASVDTGVPDARTLDGSLDAARDGSRLDAQSTDAQRLDTQVPDAQTQYDGGAGSLRSASISNADAISSRLLVRDDGNHAVAFVYQSKLRLGEYNGTAWNSRILDDGPISPCAPELAQDAQGNLHLVYQRSGSSGSETTYGVESSGQSFAHQSLMLGTSEGVRCSHRLALDSQGKPHVAFITQGTGRNFSLQYAKQNASSVFERRLVIDNNLDHSVLGLGIDAEENATVFAVSMDSRMLGDQTFANAITEIRVVNNVSTYRTIAETAADTGEMVQVFVQMDFALDSNGNSYVAYVLTPRNQSGANAVRLAEASRTGEYSLSTVASSLVNLQGISVAANANRVAIGFAEYNGAFAYTRSPTGGSYSQILIDENAENPPRISVDASGDVFAVYLDTDVTPSSLRWARR